MIVSEQYKEIIPIVVVCSNTFIAPLSVTIQSISENSNKEYWYEIYILHSSSLNLKKAELMRVTLKPNIKINFINAEKIGDTIPFTPFRKLCKEVNYDLVSPIVINQYEKFIYLDSDVVVLTDLTELYHIDIENYVLAAVKEYMHGILEDYILTNLEMDPTRYINSGVILFNRKKYLEQHILEQCIELASDGKLYQMPEQDYLSITCQNCTKYLDDKYNIRMFQTKEFVESIREPHIIHYAGVRKPWIVCNAYLREYFWQYAPNSVFYGELKYCNK